MIPPQLTQTLAALALAPVPVLGLFLGLAVFVAGFMTEAAFITATVCWCAWRIR